MPGRNVIYAFLFCLSFATQGIADQSTAGNSHWAFQRLVRPGLPASESPAPANRNPIDLFISDKLTKNGLTFSPPADKATLIRRIYFDLIGLPPTPEELAAFQSSKDPNDYEVLVERLLASPHFGERWARHWLDVVRYAETHGFEMNQPRPNAWPYRDYVIAAFNRDLPYDRFIIEQIAGDALGIDQATGFLVAGPWDQVKSPDEVLTRNQRADELHDIVNTTGTAFLGLTLGCARCHTHKFDPIPQTDYFAVKAVFDGVEHADRPVNDPEAEERLRARTHIEQRLSEIETALEDFEPIAQTGGKIDTNRLRRAVHPRLNVDRVEPVSARYLRFTILETTGNSEPCIDELEVFSPGKRKNLALAANGTKSRASGTYPNSDIHRLEHINDGKNGNGRSWISNESGRGWVELEFPEEIEIHRVVWGRDREEKFKDRLATRYRIEISRDGADWREIASSADRMLFSANEADARDYAITTLESSGAKQFKELQDEFRKLKSRLKELTGERQVYAGKFKQPEPTRRLVRGDPMSPAEVVLPGALSLIATETHCQSLSTNTPEQARRLAFAHWISSTNNPLTARVIVNRLWQYHFGEGLVSTPSDFGKNGARPTHPELLDWLAAELMHPTSSPSTQPWSLKHIHRLIVLSATYRQSSRFREDAGALDASSRLLWRFPPRRLEAEAMRDTILEVAGALDHRMGGPGWSPFEPNENYVRVYAPKSRFDRADFRRMVYATVVRQRPEGVFGVFDCPDGGQIAPKRTRSTTPLQALNLLNSGFMMQAAELLARRLESDAGTNPEKQVDRAFALAFGRSPGSEEKSHSAQFIRENGLELFCRAVLNANEFSYLN